MRAAQHLVSYLKSWSPGDEILKAPDAWHNYCLPGTRDLFYYLNFKLSYMPPQKLSSSENYSSKAITFKL